MSEDGTSLEAYRQNLRDLFGWNLTDHDLPVPSAKLTRRKGFLPLLSDFEYIEVYEALRNKAPHQKWDLRRLLWEIHSRSSSCKAIMLHVCFWYNPDLVEPAHRADNKNPLFHHFKAVLSEHEATSSAYYNDQDWQKKALDVQRTVIRFVLRNWNNLKSPETFLRERFTGDDQAPYGARFTKVGWSQLVSELHNTFPEIPFRHSDLLSFNEAGVLTRYDVQKKCASLIQHNPPLKPSEPQSRIPTPSNHAALLESVNSIIQSEYQDTHSLDGIRRPSSRGQDSYASESEYSAIVVETGSVEPPPDHLRKWLPVPVKQEVVNDNEAVSNVPYASNHGLRGVEFTPRYDESSIPPSSAPRANNFAKASPQTRTEFERPLKRRRQESYGQPAIQQHSPAVSISSPDTVHNAVPSTQPSLGRHTFSDWPPNSDLSHHQQTADPLSAARRPRHHNLSSTNPPPPANTQPASSQPQTQSQSQPQPTPASCPTTAAAATTINAPRYRILPPPANPPHTPSKTEQAVSLLQDVYDEKFTYDELLQGIACLKDEVDAGIFLTLKAGKLRDRWLKALIAGSRL